MNNMWEFNEIRQRLLITPIKGFQLDPNGICNNKCWFCPNKYTEMDKKYKVTMPINILEDIVRQFSERDDKFIWKHACHIFTANYNEVILYKHFAEMLNIFKENLFYTPLLSNGIALTPDKTDIIKKYEKVVAGIHLNIPAGNAEDYERYTGQKPEVFQKLVNNIKFS